MRILDLNADLGEGEPSDARLLELVTSANIACGGHAGDTDSMRRTLEAALESGVAVGAHPGYFDREGFGRRPQALTSRQVVDLILHQVGELGAVARAVGTRLRHVKPHGSLYNQAETDAGLARAIVAGVSGCGEAIWLYGRAGSAMEEAAVEAGIPFVAEAFADRRYRVNGSLSPRTEPGALLDDADAVLAQVRGLVERGEARARDGARVPVVFRTLCLHGDTPGSVALAELIRRDLERSGVRLAAPPPADQVRRITDR